MAAQTLNANSTLRELFAGFGDVPDIAITGVSTDSRRIRTGHAFLACQGVASHGLDYLDEAAANGAAAIVWDASTGTETEAETRVDLPMIPVVGLADRIGDIANRWFDSPSHDVRVTGVTGTNGKTTVAWLVQQCLHKLQRRCGYIGTLGAGLEGAPDHGVLTTPACIELHEHLAQFRDDGATEAAIEVSSHAIDQRRVDGMRFDAAIFTNLSRDHIDYHGGMREYFEAKASLFLDNDVRHRVVNVDCEYGVELAERCDGDVVTVSTHIGRMVSSTRYVCVRSMQTSANGSNVVISSSWGDAKLFVPLPGDFNVANATQVLALLLCHDIPVDVACDVIRGVSAPPGRMQRVRSVAPQKMPAVYVDYSHTPASLAVALKALRGHCQEKLWCVFGCGGDRDRGKRPMMGEIAEDLADIVVITNDNPRSELPADIINDILTGFKGEVAAIEDRESAIRHAIESAAVDDIILIAGKGHEDYQIIGDLRTHFSDTEVAAKHLDACAQRGAGK